MVCCTVAWLGPHRLVRDAVPLLSLLGRMAQLWHEAHTRLGENLNHQSIVETPQHREAMALSQRVRGSLGPLDTILRSERIKPDFGSDMYDSDYPWGNRCGSRCR
jgi:hypothetical protein